MIGGKLFEDDWKETWSFINENVVCSSESLIQKVSSYHRLILNLRLKAASWISKHQVISLTVGLHWKTAHNDVTIFGHACVHLLTAHGLESCRAVFQEPLQCILLYLGKLLFISESTRIWAILRNIRAYSFLWKLLIEEIGSWWRLELRIIVRFGLTSSL